MWNNFDEMQLSAYNATLEDSMKQTKRKVGKFTALSILTVGGTVLTAIFPNPITLAIAAGAATLLGGGEGLRHSLSRRKQTKAQASQLKREARDVGEKLSAFKIKRDISSLPSAPPEEQRVYPRL